MCKSYFLGGMYHLTVGELYEGQCLKEIKEELEAIHGVKTHTAATENELIYVCKNGLNKNLPQNEQAKKYQNDIDKQTAAESWNEHSELFSNSLPCSYFIHFTVEFRIGKPVYKLKGFNITHSAKCKDEEEAFFLRNKRQLSAQKGAIMKIVSHKRAKGEECNSPTSVLNILCEEIGLDSSFMYKDVKHENNKRKLKKKFDNLIAEAKRAQIVPAHYLNFVEPQYYGFKGDQKHKIDYGPWTNANEQAVTRKGKMSQMQKREKVKGTMSKSDVFETQGHKTTQNNEEKIQSCTSILEQSEVDLQQIDPCLISMISTFGNQNFDFAFGSEPLNQDMCFQGPTEMIAEHELTDYLQKQVFVFQSKL